MTLSAIADTYVEAGTAARRAGAARLLEASQRPLRRAYVRFDLGAVSRPITRVVLRLHLSRGRVGVQALDPGAHWSERGTTRANAPRTRGATIRSVRLRRPGRVSVDVTPLVGEGPRADLAISGSPRAEIASRESARPPRLTLTTSPPPLLPGPLPEPGPPPFVPPPPPPRPATLTIAQDVEPDGPHTFTYTGAPGALTLTGDTEQTLTLTPGPHTIAQTALAGWTLVELTCTGDNDATITGAEATLDADPGERIRCTYTNHQDATLAVAQDSDPDAGRPMRYTGTLGELTLTGDERRAFVLPAAEQRPVTVAQTQVAGWRSEAPVCTGDADAVVAGHGATLDVGPGEEIECTFSVVGPAPIAGVYPETSSNIGPLIDANGNLYTVTELAVLTPKPVIRKSADGGRTWVEVDGARRPTVEDLESVSLVQQGPLVHMLHQRSGYRVYYNSFLTSDAPMAADSWLTRNEEVLPATAGPEDQSVSLVARGDGTLVAFYQFSATQHAFKVRSAQGTWGPQTIVDERPGLTFSQIHVAKALDSDLIHIAYENATAHSILYRTLDPANRLGPVSELGTGVSTRAHALGNRGIVVTAAGGVERVYVAWTNTAKYLVGAAVEGGVAGPVETISRHPVYEDPDSVESNATVSSLAPGLDGRVYALYADGPSDTTGDHDLWMATRSPGGTWNAAVEALDDTDVMAISANVVTHSAANGGRTVLGVLYDEETHVKDQGAVHYTEIDLAP